MTSKNLNSGGIKRKLMHRIDRVKSTIKYYESIEDKLSKHGTWSMGYFQGKLVVLEDLLESLEEFEEEFEGGSNV